MNVRGRFLFTCWAGTLFTLAGCNFLPEPVADPTRNFVLSTTTQGPAAAVGANAPAVQLRPIELASYLKARPLIVRKSENEIEFREFAIWGESLELGIARVMREELLASGAASAVQISTAGGRNLGDLRELRVRVLACEGGADGAVHFRAAWELSTPASRQVRRGDYRAEGLRWDGKNEATLALGLSEAVAGLARDIATALIP